MRASKAFPPFFLILLLIPFTSLGFFQPVHGNPALILTITPDKTTYFIELDQIHIQANLTDDGPVSDGLIALEVDNPDHSPVVFRTLQTDTPPTNVNINITQAFLADQYGEPIYSVLHGADKPWFFVEIRNVGHSVLTSLLITVNFYQRLFPFPNPIMLELEGTLPVNETYSVHQKLNDIPWDWVSTGIVEAYVNVFSTNPHNFGYSHCPEKSATFEIVYPPGSPPSGASPPSGSQSYNLTFKVPPSAENGTYYIYGCGRHGEEVAPLVGSQITVELPPPTPPLASFEYIPSEPYVNGSITFDASVSMPQGGNITSYEWDFGDNEFNTSKFCSHSYTQSNTYLVTLNVTDSEGLWDITSKSVTVSSTFGPTADFAYLPSEPWVNGTTYFDASSTTLGWNGTAHPPIEEYEWNFDDGTPPVVEYDPIATHRFGTEDTFNVTLKVTDSEGLWSTKSEDVAVHVAAESHDIIIKDVAYKPSGIAENLAYEPPAVYNTTSFDLDQYPPLNITVFVRNNGTVKETFDLNAYYNVTATAWTLIETKPVTLWSWEEQNVSLTWDTAGLDLYVGCTLRVNVSILDPHPEDNEVTDGTIDIRIPGDCAGPEFPETDGNGDGKVGWQDLFTVAAAYGSKPDDDHWNPYCDFNGDGKANWMDLFILAGRYGTKYP